VAGRGARAAARTRAAGAPEVPSAFKCVPSFCITAQEGPAPAPVRGVLIVWKKVEIQAMQTRLNAVNSLSRLQDFHRYVERA